MGQRLMGETEVLEIEQRADLAARELADPEVCRKYAKKAAEDDIPALVGALREALASSGGGGDLGLMLRNSVKARIMRESQTLKEDDRRLVSLCDDVNVHSMTVSSIAGQGCVFVDIRLAVGDKPVVR